MPIPSPFHSRTAPLCHSLRWKEWAGHYAVCSYDTSHEREYLAFRHAAGLLDVSPLYKTEVTGPDAGRFLSYVLTRDVIRQKPWRVAYCSWCDDAGKLLDDGTVTCLEEDRFRLTSADPAFYWLRRHSLGFRVNVEDVTTTIAAVALQGPTSRAILTSASSLDLDTLRFFGATHARIDAFDAVITRTGYTGDLGYEVWVEAAAAVKLWDALMAHGKPYGIEPAGLDALDVVRLEAGFILNGVDYFSARHCTIESRKSSPYEVGLGGTVALEREPFIGQAALQREQAQGSDWALVGIEADWDELAALYESYGLPPHLPATASRTGAPIYKDGLWVGYVTSHTWSPTLKKYIGLATLKSPHAGLGHHVELEVTVEFQRRTVTATVVPRPFFDPPRKRA